MKLTGGMDLLDKFLNSDLQLLTMIDGKNEIKMFTQLALPKSKFLSPILC